MELQEFIHSLNMAARHDALPEEAMPNVAEWVFQPCIETPLAPREARAILEVFGRFRLVGIPSYIGLMIVIDRMLAQGNPSTPSGMGGIAPKH